MNALARSGVRPPPPHGFELLRAVRAEGAPRNLFVFTGPNSWTRAQNWSRGARLVLPPDCTPDDFDWSCVRGLDLVVNGRDERLDRLERLAYLLCVVAKATLVVVIYTDGPLTRVQCYRSAELDRGM